MSQDLTTKIRKAAAWDSLMASNAWMREMDAAENHNEPGSQFDFVRGSKHQHAQNAWMREALEIAVQQIKSDACPFCDDGQQPEIYPKCLEFVQCSALKEIAALVPKGDVEDLYLGKTCGDCYKWMKKSLCPAEKGFQVGGPSANSPKCKDFQPQPTPKGEHD
jgi:hypothetical protein